MSRKKRVANFTASNKDTRIVYTDAISDAPETLPNKDDFLKYHGGTGPNYPISAVTEGDTGKEYLQLVCTGGRWDPNQLAFNNQLQFVPAPDIDLPANRPGVLVVKKEIIEQDGGLKIGLTGWTLHHARLQKYALGSDELNDVIMTWKHEDWPDFVVSCWKW